MKPEVDSTSSVLSKVLVPLRTFQEHAFVDATMCAAKDIDEWIRFGWIALAWTGLPWVSHGIESWVDGVASNVGCLFWRATLPCEDDELAQLFTASLGVV